MKHQYIELMEKVLKAYSEQDIQDYIEDVRQNSLKEHGFPRLTANIGILIAHNKAHDLKELFLEMMNLCCDQIARYSQASHHGRQQFFRQRNCFLYVRAGKSQSF